MWGHFAATTTLRHPTMTPLMQVPHRSTPFGATHAVAQARAASTVTGTRELQNSWRTHRRGGTDTLPEDVHSWK